MDLASAARADDDEAAAAALEAGRLLFAGECRFVAGAASLEQLPPMGLPEVAFAGRSNVGKSSLINALTGRNALARTSDTPGRTRQLNFFALADRLLLVDLPGHGYARAAKAEIARWSVLIDAYLRGRASLARICLLVDARHGLKAPDRALMDRLDKAAVVYQAVLTKCDTLDPGAVERCAGALAAELARRPAAHPALIATSAVSGLGIGALRAALAALAAPA
jgi:GTP-binding protein